MFRSTTVSRRTLAVTTLTFSLITLAHAAYYTVRSLDLGGGFSLNGEIQTDGTVGPITASNITNWNLSIDQYEDFVFTEATTSNFSSGVTISGNQLRIPTSTNGIDDGGSLWFRGGTYNQVQVADFTALNTSGGQSFFSYGGFSGSVSLGAPDNSSYIAGTVRSGSGNLFDLTPVDFGGGISLFGTVTAEYQAGITHISHWNVIVRSSTTWNFNSSNSAILSDLNLGASPTELYVTPDSQGQYGQFIIGRRVGFDLFGTLLADYSYVPGGEAGFITSSIYQTVSPLDLNSAGNHVVATAVPEPSTLVVLALGGSALLRRRSKVL